MTTLANALAELEADHAKALATFAAKSAAYCNALFATQPAASTPDLLETLKTETAAAKAAADAIALTTDADRYIALSSRCPDKVREIAAMYPAALRGFRVAAKPAPNPQPSSALPPQVAPYTFEEHLANAQKRTMRMVGDIAQYNTSWGCWKTKEQIIVGLVEEWVKQVLWLSKDTDTPRLQITTAEGRAAVVATLRKMKDEYSRHLLRHRKRVAEVNALLNVGCVRCDKFPNKHIKLSAKDDCKACKWMPQWDINETKVVAEVKEFYKPYCDAYSISAATANKQWCIMCGGGGSMWAAIEKCDKNYVGIRFDACKHIFHHKCLAKWFTKCNANGDALTCPNCGVNVDNTNTTGAVVVADTAANKRQRVE